MKLTQSGNTKLVGQYMFNLPATYEVCGRLCKGCYATREQKRFKSVLQARNKRLDASMSKDFVSTINKEIANIKKPFKYFRIHASGEFYSQDYIDSWTEIAKANKNITFYAFTKRMADFNFRELMSQPNAVIINSLAHNRINYGTMSDLKNHPCKNLCPATVKATKKDTVCGVTCNFCMTKKAQIEGITFVKH